MRKLLASLVYITCLLSALERGLSFSVVRTTNKPLHNHQHCYRASSGTKIQHDKYTRLFPLAAQESEDETDDSLAQQTDLGDEMSGLASYLGPYALAFLASLAVMVGFVNFVLLDY